MPLYMYQASYTAKSMAEQLKEPQDPVETIRPALADLGATIVVAGFPFGEYDVVVVYEAPDDMTAASVAMAVAAAGEIRSGKTTRLLSGQEWLESLRKRRIVTNRKARQPHDSQSWMQLGSGVLTADCGVQLRGQCAHGVRDLPHPLVIPCARR
jgi:uncharacterized protein with GYD domain